MSGLESGLGRRGWKIDDRRAEITVEPVTIVELHLPSRLQTALTTAGEVTGAWVSKTGTALTVSGNPDEVSGAIESLHPPRDPSIPHSQTRGLNGPTSLRAKP